MHCRRRIIRINSKPLIVSEDSLDCHNGLPRRCSDISRCGAWCRRLVCLHAAVDGWLWDMGAKLVGSDRVWWPAPNCLQGFAQETIRCCCVPTCREEESIFYRADSGGDGAGRYALYAFGNWILISRPEGRRFAAYIFPLCRRIASAAMARPRPFPPAASVFPFIR